MKYQAVCFDFDYTLGDATQAIYAAFCHALTTMGHPKPDLEAVRRTVGMAMPDAYTLLTGDSDSARQREFYDLFHPVARDLQAQGMVELYPGARELLTGLRAKGLSAALVSTKNIQTLETVLELRGLQGLFDQVIGSGTVASIKPDPEGLLLAIHRMGVSREATLYCGDTTIDAQTAKNAGVDFCAVLNGTTPAQAFLPYPHVHIAPDLWDLSAWLPL